jgi:hypothetical protein
VERVVHMIADGFCKERDATWRTEASPTMPVR